MHTTFLRNKIKYVISPFTFKVKKVFIKGFTLIELLVVISIIALITSILLAALNRARFGSQNAKVQEELSQLKNAIALYYTANNNYGITVQGDEPRGTSVGTGCATGMFADPSISAILQNKNFTLNTLARCSVNFNGTGYAVSLPLTDGTFWCVDTTGNAVAMSYHQWTASNACVPSAIGY